MRLDISPAVARARLFVNAVLVSLCVAVVMAGAVGSTAGCGSTSSPTSSTKPCYQQVTCSGTPNTPCLNCWESNIEPGCCPAATPFLCSGNRSCYTDINAAGSAASKGGFTCVAPAYRSCS